jgi:hypothetical protein
MANDLDADTCSRKADPDGYGIQAVNLKTGTNQHLDYLFAL